MKTKDVKTISVSNPMACPFNSGCQCSLYDEIEGETANKCPDGVYGDYKFPDLCSLRTTAYIMKTSNVKNNDELNY